MHEMSLCESIMQIIEDEAQRQGFERVIRVRLEIGRLSGVEIEAMRFGFDAVTRDSLADGAELEIIEAAGYRVVPVPAAARSRCGSASMPARSVAATSCRWSAATRCRSKTWRSSKWARAARPGVLIVDDEPLSLQTLRRTLDEEFEVFTAGSAAEATGILETERIHAVLADQRMPEQTGVAFLTRVREQWPDVVRMIISGYTDPDDIIEGVNGAGIYQFVSKPWHPDSLLLIVRNACELYRLQRENALMTLEMRVATPTLEKRLDHQRSVLQRSYRLDGIVRSPDSPINAVCEQVAQIAPYDISVLIDGESGTGKGAVRACHSLQQ